MDRGDPERRKKHRPRKDQDEVEVDEFKMLSLSRINGEINRMKKGDMIRLLEKNRLHTKGVKEVLSRRLKNFYRRQRLQTQIESGQQPYKNYLIIDFEATCEAGRNPDYLHEIIEFPAVLVDGQTGEIKDEFHSYCRPSTNPTLSEFCTSLTGITQSDVDRAPPFHEVLKSFESWMHERDLLLNRACAFVSDGPWDFSRFLNIQCCLSEIKYPKWARKWINIKKVYGNFYKLKKPKIGEMLSNLGLEFEGRLHCGLDDAKNLARIVSRLIEDECVLQVNERLNAGQVQSISEAERKLMTPEHGGVTKNNVAEASDQGNDKYHPATEGTKGKETHKDATGALEDMLKTCSVG